MKNKANIENQFIQTDDIDLIELIQKVWKEKILILSFSLIFFILAFFYASFKPKEFKTTIVLKNVHQFLFLKYNSVLGFSDKNNLELILKNEFFEKITSSDNLEEFILQNDKISSFKELLKKKEISAKNYFLNRIGPASKRNREKNIDKDIFFLNFPTELKGDEFLNDYVVYTFNNSTEFVKSHLISLLKNKKEIYSQSLSIAKKLNIENPIIKQMLEDRNLYTIIKPNELYYNGVKILQNEIDNLNELIANITDFKLNFNPILDKATKPIIISQSPLIIGMAGLIAGFFLSIIYIALRNILKVNDKY